MTGKGATCAARHRRRTPYGSAQDLGAIIGVWADQATDCRGGVSSPELHFIQHGNAEQITQANLQNRRGYTAKNQPTADGGGLGRLKHRALLIKS